MGIGKFSISEDKQVCFAPGNLRYTQSTSTWSFATAQYEVLGVDNVICDSTSSELALKFTKLGTALADKVDLFGWSTNSTSFGISTSTSSSDYSGAFVDWGANQIDDYAPNTWRTLSYSEWHYLSSERPNCLELCGVAQVNGVNGLIFLPDNWICPNGVTFKSGLSDSNGMEYYATHQIFTSEEWSQLEFSGAIFLPTTGFRIGTTVGGIQKEGHYWSATKCENISYNAKSLRILSLSRDYMSNVRYHGSSVRLVRDTLLTPSILCGHSHNGVGVFSVGDGKTVTFSPGNLQYTQSTNTWSFARAQYEVLGTENVVRDSSSDTILGDCRAGTAHADEIDLFGWSASETMNFGVSTSMSSYNYYGDFEDWGINKIGNDTADTWRTLKYKEWYYLRWKRPSYAELVGVAQVNGINGLVLLPDDWVCPEGISFKSGFQTTSDADQYATYQAYTHEQWQVLENAGAVFLPAAGYRYGLAVDVVQRTGYYWVAPEDNKKLISCLLFGPKEASLVGVEPAYGYSVRLVKDVTNNQ